MKSINRVQLTMNVILTISGLTVLSIDYYYFSFPISYLEITSKNLSTIPVIQFYNLHTDIIPIFILVLYMVLKTIELMKND